MSDRKIPIAASRRASHNEAMYQSSYAMKSTSAPIDDRILQVCRAIESGEETPTLRELAQLIGLSEYHLQRQFKAALGLTPRQYAGMLKRERLRDRLQRPGSVTGAIFDAGFGSVSTAYERSSNAVGMTFSQFRAGGDGLEIAYAIAPSAFGYVLVAATDRGICRVDLDDDRDELEPRLQREFSRATLRREDDHLDSAMSRIVAYLSGVGEWPRLPVHVRATVFQARVWEALRGIAPGSRLTYSQVARAIGSPRAARAVARACASNPVALLIPCHRIVPESGGVGGYRWNPPRKHRLLELEGAAAGP